VGGGHDLILRGRGRSEVVQRMMETSSGLYTSRRQLEERGTTVVQAAEAMHKKPHLHGVIPSIDQMTIASKPEALLHAFQA
jgi:hypothetical protein